MTQSVWIGSDQGLLGVPARYHNESMECMLRIFVCLQVVVRDWMRCGNSWFDHLLSSFQRLVMAWQRVKGYSKVLVHRMDSDWGRFTIDLF